MKYSSVAIKNAATIQRRNREMLVNDLNTICTNCESAYDGVIARLVPIKNAYQTPELLAVELRQFAADGNIRALFKPRFLCGQVDVLLAMLHSYLDPLKYSVDLKHIDDIRQELSTFGDVDKEILIEYDQFTASLDKIATQLQGAEAEPKGLSKQARERIEGFEAELRTTQADLADARSTVVGLI
jgi:hypothetical protein